MNQSSHTSYIERKHSMDLWIKYFTIAIALFIVPIRESNAATIKSIPSNGTQPYATTPSGRKIPLYTRSAALVISASNYSAGTSGWQKLPATAREMDTLTKVLSEQGFEVIRIYDPTREIIVDEMQKFLGKYGSDEKARLMIFYSGHGYTSNTNQMGYIVPINATNPNTNYPKFIAQAISLESFTGWIKQFKAKHFLAVFDSCFSGALFSTKANTKTLHPRPIDFEGRWRFLTNATIKDARQFISAGGPDEELPAVSTFTRLFIKGIQGHASSISDGYTTGKELGIYLEQNVSSLRAGKQNPISGFPSDLHTSYGDFIFQHTEARTASEMRDETRIPDDRSGTQNSIVLSPPESVTIEPKSALLEEVVKSNSTLSDLNSNPIDNTKRDRELLLVLSGTNGRDYTDHLDALRTLSPLIPKDLSGDEIARLLGATSYTYRINSLSFLLTYIPQQSIPGKAIPKILGSESYSYRLNLIRSLLPHMAPEISESEAQAILGDLSYSDRVSAIKLIAKLIKKPISQVGLSNLTADMFDSDKPALILLLSR